MYAATRRGVSAVLLALLVAAWALSSDPVTLTQAESAPQGTSDDDLAARLLHLEDQFGQVALLPVNPLTDVDELLEDDAVQPVALEATAQIGRLRATSLELDAPMRALYEDAERARTSVGDAVGDAARAWLVMAHGFELAETAVQSDAQLDLGLADVDGVAVGRDYPAGAMEAALRTFVEATDRLAGAHHVLAAVPGLDPVTQAAYRARTVEWETFRKVDERVYRAFLGDPDTALVVAVDRFESRVLGIEARARSATYVCVDRDVYEAVLEGLPPESAAAVSVATDTCLDIALG